MLTISKPLSATQAQTYHAKEFTSPEQSYWRRGQAVTGEWQGQLADKFGLVRFRRSRGVCPALEGQNPQTGEQLVQHRQAHQYTNGDGKTITSSRASRGLGCHFLCTEIRLTDRAVGGDDRVRVAHREAVDCGFDGIGAIHAGDASAATIRPKPPGNSLPPNSSTIQPARWMATPRRSSTRTPSSSI